ncbi:hypothetical protein Tco_0778035 [Tanacetum coccineum]
MPTSYTYVTSYTRHFIPYIILTDFEDDTTSDVSAPLSLDHVSASSGYSSDFDSDSELTKDDLLDEDLIKTAESLRLRLL